MADYGIFRTNDAKKIAQATRIVLGGPRNYVHVPHRVPNKSSAAGPAAEEEPDDGFPPGTDGCPCGNCLAGVTIPDASGPGKCCTSHLRWSLVNPWLTCADTDLTLEYVSNADGWLSEVFEGPSCDDADTFNEYRWQLMIDVDGRSTLTLLLVTDNGCDPVCIVYGRDSFQCQCNNSFTLEKPYGQFIGVSRADLSCKACIKPVIRTNDTIYDCIVCGGVPQIVYVKIQDFANGTSSNCDANDGVFELEFLPSSASGPNCTWYVSTADGASDCVDPTTNNSAANVTFGIRRSNPLDGEPADSILARVTVRRTPGGNYAWEKFFDGCESLAGGWIAIDELQPNSDGSAGCTDPAAGTFDDLCVPPAAVEVLFGGYLGPATSDGVCDETCGEPPAPADPLGSCCISGVCYDGIEEALCADFGGAFDADNGCVNLVCESDPNTPCCVGGSCIETDIWTCVNVLGGTVAAGECADGPCDEGACCDATDGTCSLQLEADCPSPNYFWGAGTDCSPDPCAGVGMCCMNPADPSNNCVSDPNCECVLLTLAECDAVNGVYDGDDTFCGAPGTTCECRSAICDIV